MIRRVRLRSLAKLNLDLRVLHKRADGFHELRTVFQTISLGDNLYVEYEAAKRTAIEIEVSANGEILNIADNLVVRAAHSVLDALKIKAHIRFQLKKSIPMGGGLGGGSSNAAAILLALPVLAGRSVPYERLLEIGAALGSDVPFFLEGGTAVAVDRGTEIYSLPDIAQEPILVVASGIHVATGPAYQALGRDTIAPPRAADEEKRYSLKHKPRDQPKLTSIDLSRSINSFQCFVRSLGVSRSAKVASAFSANDFEPVVFSQHPQLKLLAAKLRKIAGREAVGARAVGWQASGARMTGSGSTLFAIFGSKVEREGAEESLKKDRVFGECRVIPASLVSRGSYQRMWRKQLAEHVVSGSDSGDLLWPPQSRHAT